MDAFVRYWFKPDCPYGCQRRILTVHRSVVDANNFASINLFPEYVPEELELKQVPFEAIWVYNYGQQTTPEQLDIKGNFEWFYTKYGSVIHKKTYKSGAINYIKDVLVGNPKLQQKLRFSD